MPITVLRAPPDFQTLRRPCGLIDSIQDLVLSFGLQTEVLHIWILIKNFFTSLAKIIENLSYQELQFSDIQGLFWARNHLNHSENNICLRFQIGWRNVLMTYFAFLSTLYIFVPPLLNSVKWCEHSIKLRMFLMSGLVQFECSTWN